MKGGRTICRVARRLRFSTVKTIVSDVRRSHHYQSVSAPLVGKILHKCKLQSFKRKRKSYISVKIRAYRLQWTSALREWPAEFRNDAPFLMSVDLASKNDSRTQRVWRMTFEAENLEFFQPKFKNALSIMFWAVSNGRSNSRIRPNVVGRLVLCDQKMNVSLLHENLN